MGTDPHFMNRYYSRLSDDTVLLRDLLETIIPTLDKANASTLLVNRPEPSYITLGRKLGLVSTPIEQRCVSGFPIPGYETEALMLTRLAYDGRAGLSSFQAGGHGAYIRYEIGGYLLKVLSENRWVDLKTYEKRFVALYEAIVAHFLPASHELHVTAKKLRKDIAPKPDKRAVVRSA